MSQPINIVKLMEENPNTKLSKPYQGRLINKLKESFSTDEQQIFISSFYCYLNYKSDDFVIDLDDIWSWLGYTKKDKGKDLLEKFFKVDEDYKRIFPDTRENSSIGRPKEKIMMSIKTFKKMCLKANTSKANEIHEYYIKLEETLHEVIDEESDELRMQLQMKDEESDELRIQLLIRDEEIQIKYDEMQMRDNTIKKLRRETQVVDGRNVCYLCTAEEKESEGIYTIGKAIDLQKRLNSYNDNKLFNFKIVYYISCKTIPLMDSFEKILLSKLNKYKIVSRRDVFQLPPGKDVYFFIQWFDYLSIFVEDIEDDLVLEERTDEEIKELNDEIFDEEKESTSIYNKEYRMENHEDILEREANFRLMNSEQIRERRLDYEFNNRDKINDHKKMMSSTEEAKEKKKEYMKVYRKENAEKIAASKKAYNEGQKEILEERVNCKCGSIVSKQNLSSHLVTDRHKKYLETGKTVDELRKEEFITCICGISVSKRGVKRHEESKLHKCFVESQKSLSESIKV